MRRTRFFNFRADRILALAALSCISGLNNASAAPYFDPSPPPLHDQTSACAVEPQAANYWANIRPQQPAVPRAGAAQCSWESAIVAIFSRLYPSYTGDTESQEKNARGFASPIFRDSRSLPHALRIKILADSRPNAFADPEDNAQSGGTLAGGAIATPSKPATIFLSSGLLGMLRSESELAFIIAHEMAHLRFDHFPPDLSEMVLSDSQLRHISHVHQRWELEADREALERVADAGYNPFPATAVLERLVSLEGESAQAFGRRHPSIGERLRTLRQFMYHTQRENESPRAIDDTLGPQAMR